MIRSLTSPRIALGALLLLGACHVRLDASHCWNNGGNAQERNDLCDLRYGTDGGAPLVCSPCVSGNDGCVQTAPEVGECPRYDDEVATAADAGSSVGTTEDPGATSMVDTGAMTTTTTATGPMTTDDDGTTTGDAEPFCGDGIKNGDEKCDGDDLGRMTCASIGTIGGDLACAPNCEFDFSGCMGLASCGNEAIEGGEECDGTNLGGASCATVSDYDRGMLTCAACQYNTTDCCYSNNHECNGHGECCSGNCSGLLLPMVLATCKP